MTLVVRDSFKRLRVRLHPLGAASVAALVSDSTPPLNLAPLMAGEPAPRPVDKPGDKGRYRNGRRPRATEQEQMCLFLCLSRPLFAAVCADFAAVWEVRKA
jgi:hypothetical protein